MKKLFTVMFIFLLSFTLTACGNFNFGFYDSNPPLYEEFKLPTTLTFEQYKRSYVANYEDIDKEDIDFTLTANIKIENDLYNTGGLADLFLAPAYNGSGVIFYETSEFYYALTNHHVIETEADYPNQKITVIDYYNNKYDAAIYPGSVDEDLDIAIIVFDKIETNAKLGVLKLVDGYVSVATKVIAIGNPDGKRNIITHGHIYNYDYTIVEDKNGNDKYNFFNAIIHTAKIGPGSSGGMLIDFGLQIIGVNFAAIDIEPYHSFAIPSTLIIDHINEFLVNQQ